MRGWRRSRLAGLAFAALLPADAFAACPGRFAVEVLGSGGPLADDDRASAGYLVWIDGEARLMIDAGGGTFLRFAEARAKVASLEGILISHFHADHASDLPAILKSGSFEGRTAALTVAGPSGNDYFPGLAAFLDATLDTKTGAYRYLGGYLSGEGLPKLSLKEVDAGDGVIRTVVDAPPLKAGSIPVNHGDVPALAFIVTVDNKTAVFAGDQSAFSDAFDEALAGTSPDLLIAHHAIREGPGQPRGLHRAPSSIGEMAAAMKARKLVLSHNMQRALANLDRGLKAIRNSYDGAIEIAGDHTCQTLIP